MELGPKNQIGMVFWGPNSIGSVYGPSGYETRHCGVEGAFSLYFWCTFGGDLHAPTNLGV